MIQKKPETFFMEWDIKYFDYDNSKIKYFLDRLITDDKKKIIRQKELCRKQKQNYYIYKLLDYKGFENDRK